MSFERHPILNSPYTMPIKHWLLDENGQPSGQTIDGRRKPGYVVPVAGSRRTGVQGELTLEDREASTDNTLVRLVRPEVDRWRLLPPSKWNVTPETERLLRWWRDPKVREFPFFFCQLEAVETIIWLTEVAPKEFRDKIREANDTSNPGLFRIAAKMATGSGKTTVMAMLIAWQAINAARRPNSTRFTNGFLVISPGITIRDRLRVLEPESHDSYFTDPKRMFIPPEMMGDLLKARVVVTNFHSFQLRETAEIAAGTRKLLADRGEEPKRFPETEGEMLRRATEGKLDGCKRVIVLNDEAHHCYRMKPGDSEEGKVSGEESDEAKKNSEQARIWITGIEALARTKDLVGIYDLSATPFFLRGSGYPEGTLFPWVVSDFSLMDAIECGIVKTPRLPVLDNSVSGDMPKFRELYKNIDPKDLPKKGRKTGGVLDPENIPELLRAALDSFYKHYEETYAQWEQAGIERPPVFIVVANNTATSKLIYDFISGYEKELKVGDKTGTRLINGKLPLFDNANEYGQWRDKPRTLLIDSEALEAGDSLPDDFKRAAAKEIEEFRKQLERRDHAAAQKLTDAQILREVMNTVGQPGMLGGEIRCVVSVSMLTEGWDANTVTHILGVRAFGTQLLCEQVVGRGLRRVNYQPDGNGMLSPEYADVLGVPFDFTRNPSNATPKPPPKMTRIRALPERQAKCEIRWPNVAGYRVAYPNGPLKAVFSPESKLTVTPDDIPTRTDIEPIVGEGIQITLENYATQRMKAVYFAVAGYTLRRYFREDATPKEFKPGEEPEPTEEGAIPLHRFGELLKITERWFEECLTCQGQDAEALKRLFLWRPMAQKAAERIARACAPSSVPEMVRIIPHSYNEEGSSRFVDFVTSKQDLFRTDPEMCHVDHVVADSDWEKAFTVAIERELADICIAYIKNHNLGFEVPYEYRGEMHQYRPDFILKINDGNGQQNPLHLIIEVKGKKDDRDTAKVDTMHRQWVPAVNAARKYGRWAYAMLESPHTFGADVRAFLAELRRRGAA